VKLIFSKNNLDITANTPEVGEAKESIAITYKGKEFNIAFNPEFLMDPLKNIESDEIFFDFIDELSPGVIKYKRPFLTLHVAPSPVLEWSYGVAAKS